MIRIADLKSISRTNQGSIGLVFGQGYLLESTKTLGTIDISEG